MVRQEPKSPFDTSSSIYAQVFGILSGSNDGERECVSFPSILPIVRAERGYLSDGSLDEEVISSKPPMTRNFLARRFVLTKPIIFVARMMNPSNESLK